MALLVGDGQLFTAFGSPAGKYISAIGRGHPLAEAMLVPSLSE
jgi:hypothetical protein